MSHRNKSISGKNVPESPAAEAANVTGDGASVVKACLVVAIGASAGGQEALEQMFTALPTDCGISFVVVMHLPPDGPSFLAEMLARYTAMEVVTAENGMELTPNRVFVIPAGRELTVKDDRLLTHLGDPESPRRAHHPIDQLLFSLALEKKEDAIAVILSGFGTDGTEGAKKVRDLGGTVIVQDPSSAASPAMPRSTIAAGAAHFVLPGDEIAEKIAEIARGSCSLTPRACQPTNLDEDLNAIFDLVKASTGHDFSSYKTNTVMRRIERRMMVNEVGGLGKYIVLLKENPQEASALCQDILIGVTSFFRDPEAFAVLTREIVPRLFPKGPCEPVRIWHACCASGEEVYSMAMLIREYLDQHRLQTPVQLFATDIDEVSIAQARAGLYDDDSVAHLGEKRLKSFFTRRDGRWQVAKQLRDMVVFAHHSLIKDPPFSRLDLLVCRNFLIYLNPDMQKRLISLFHQVVKPGGFIFLGSAESVGHRSDLFIPFDKKWKIFERRAGEPRSRELFPLATSVRVPKTSRPGRKSSLQAPGPGAFAEKLLMERYSPPCVVVNEKYEVVHVSTRTASFLEVPVGEPTRDILKMAREELRPALRSAIYKAFAEERLVAFRGVKVSDALGESSINLLVEPVEIPQEDEKLLMVVFEPATPVAETSPNLGDESSQKTLIRQMEEQLRITHEQLQATTDQLDASNEGFLSTSEELMSINEEFQSANEELQSTNEELETSKEELQALNEELVTVNAELQGKVEDLNQANSHMENLLASSEIATLFLDRQLNLTGFTPAAASIFNLISSDVGRTFRHFAGKIDWGTLTRDVETVLAGEPFAEREVTTLDSERCYLKRIFPYRNPEGRIDGIVVSLIDITARKRAEIELEGLFRQRQLALDAAGMGWWHYDPVTRDASWDDGFKEIFGVSGYQGPNEEILARIHPEDLPGVWAKVEAALDPADPKPYQAQFRINLPDGATRFIEAHGTALFEGVGEGKRAVSFVGTVSDISERRRAEEAKARLAAIVESSDDAIFGTDVDGNITAWNGGAERLFGYRAGDTIGRPVTLLVPPELQEEEETIRQRLAMGHRIEHYETVRLAKDGRRIDVSLSVSPIRDGEGRIIGASEIARDVTDQRRTELENKTTVEFLRLVNESTTVRELVEAAAGFFQRQSGCEALGIRLKEGEDFPYYEVRGFPQEFVLLENELCSHDTSGDLLRDQAGNPVIACMCGNVICGRFDETKPFFTHSGSFWSNCTTKLLTSTSKADRQARTRNRCNGEGYESVALVPLRFGGEHLGLIQLNDKRCGMFTPQGIALWERLAGYLAVALTKFKAEEALHESEEQFHTLADAIPQLSWMANADGWIFWYNRRWYEYTGTSAEQMEGWGWQSVHDPEALPRVMERWQGSIATGRPFDMVFPLRGADGVFRPFLTRVMPVCDQGGKVVRWFGTNTDISEQRRSEEALRESEERYRTLFNSLFEGFCIIEVLFDGEERPIDYRFIEINSAFQAQTGLIDAQGKRMRELAPDHEAHWFEIYGKVALTGKPVSFVNEAKALDRWFDVSAYRVGEEKSRKVAILFNDITESRHTAERLKKAKEVAEAATRAKSIFLANMSHELRTPMTGILGMLDLALSGELDQQQREQISIAQVSARSLIRILNDILDMSRIEAGKLSIEEKPFSVRGCVEQTYNILLPVAKNKRLDLFFTVADEVPKTLVGDQTRLGQVLANLTGNAVKFTSTGKVKIRVTAGKNVSGGRQEFTFTVTDTGIGIPADKKDLLFQVFSQVDDSHSREFGGTGLGLSISKELVERMGGTISFTSEEGLGSSFSCTIPFAVVEIEPEAIPDPGKTWPIGAPASPFGGRNPRLLVAEDDQVIRQVLGSVLKRTHYDIEFAENGQMAIEMWEKGAFDLILMDVQMPRKNGFEATAAIREMERSRGGHIPIIAMTAHALKEDEQRCLDAGMDSYISKPIDIRKTLHAIGEALEKGGCGPTGQ